MDSQHHLETNVLALINLEVPIQMNCTGCKQGDCTLVCLLWKIHLVLQMCYYVNSLSIVLKKSEHITIYSNEIAQHNQFEQIEMFNMFKCKHFKMVICENRIQWATWIWEILLMFCDVLLHNVLLLAACKGIPITKFKLKIMCAVWEIVTMSKIGHLQDILKMIFDGFALQFINKMHWLQLQYRVQKGKWILVLVRFLERMQIKQ